MTQQYSRALPRVVILHLDTALDIGQFLAATPPGSLVTMISFVQVDPGVSLQLAFGQQSPPLTVFQGQTLSFGGSGDCPGVCDLGLSLGTGGVSVAGGTVQILLTYYGGVVSLLASQ